MAPRALTMTPSSLPSAVFKKRKLQKSKHVLKTISTLEENIYTFFGIFFSLISGYVSLYNSCSTIQHISPFTPFYNTMLSPEECGSFSKCQVLQANTQTLVKQQTPQQSLGVGLYLTADGGEELLLLWKVAPHPAPSTQAFIHRGPTPSCSGS